MPKNGQNCSKIAEYLETLEDTTLYTKKSRTKCFESLKTIFEEHDIVTAPEVQRILAVFMNCIKEDIHCLPHAITAISSLLTKAKIIPTIPIQDLLPSAFVLLHLLKTLCVSSGTDKLRELSFEAFLSYPVNVLSTMVTCNCTEILEIFEVYKPKDLTEIKMTKESCVFLQKLLVILPSDQKKQFVKEGIAIWLGDLVPTVMHIVACNDNEHKLLYLECLETLTEALVDVDYFQSPQWQLETLECICNAQKYPLVIKQQLNNGSTIWHRLWIVFVKMLKNQITRVFGTYRTPINSMLPVVEIAFKMDVPNRCRAFQCWDNLIDNFSKETNENCLPKRLKLLLIPLKLNNAKTEETALAKFHTWWNLLRKFKFKLNNMIMNDILIAFVHYAFGMRASENRAATVGASQSYHSVKNVCLQAFAEIVGHVNCNCCTDLPKLTGKIMNNKLLASNWDDWMYALKAAIQLTNPITNKSGNEKFKKNMMPVLCAWKALVTSIAELPPNGVRRDMFSGLIQVLIDLAETSNSSEKIPEILFTLTLSLFEGDEKIKNALITTNRQEPPLHKIMSIIINPGMQIVYKRYEAEIMVEMLKPLTNLIVESMTADWLIDNLPPSENFWKLWAALVHSVKDSQIGLCPPVLTKLLVWPIKAIHQITEEKYAATTWCTMYNLNDKRHELELEKEILECIQEKGNNKTYFKLCLTICLLKEKLVKEEDTGVLPEILQNLTSQVSDCKEFEQAVPMIVDAIIMMLNNLIALENERLAKAALNCVKNMLVMTSETKSYDNETSNPINANIFIMLNNVFKAVDPLFKIPLYSTANSEFIDALREHALPLSKKSSLFKFILTQMKTLLSNCSIDTVKSKIYDSIKMLKENQNEIKSDINRNTNKIAKEFMSPDVSKGVKKTKKKEASIVNTVVENGEEYVVVKSNWKFNPKKLTENQKEKFQRKREDIPALYQDLSQSQDEFKLSSWKTDSQDTTSSNSKSSKSSKNDSATTIFNNIPSFENALSSEKVKNPISETKTTSVKDSASDLPTDKPNKVKQSPQFIPKNTKSPRMALKDRVFRNVRNLIEKSTPKNDTKETIVAECQIENFPKTPTSDPLNNLTKSAPSILSADRPLRTRRKPKKFDDVELFGLKKRRISQTDSQSDPLNDRDINMLNESMQDNLDNDIQNINQAGVNIDNINIEIDQELVNQGEKTVLSVQIEENVECDQDVPEQEVTAVTQREATKDALNEPITENILCSTKKNEDVLHNNMQDKNIVQDSQNNDAMEKIDDNNVAIELNSETENNKNEIVTLKTPARKTKEPSQTPTSKKSGKKMSRIETQLAIDMVNPFNVQLNVQSAKRLRKKVIESESTKKSKSELSKLNKTKTESKISFVVDNKSSKKENLTDSLRSTSMTVEETHKRSISLEDAPCSEDVIESSQDSTFTTISVKSTKRTPNRLPIVAVIGEKLDNRSKIKDTGTQDLLQDLDCEILSAPNKSSFQVTDIELEKNQELVTVTDDVIVINDDEEDESPIKNHCVKSVGPEITICCEKNVGGETQELAEADTQPNDPADFVALESGFVTFESTAISPIKLGSLYTAMDTTEHIPIINNTSINIPKTQEDVIEIASEPNELPTVGSDKDDMCSPFKDDAQRKQDFLNNTSEISPIKVQSPDKEKASSSLEKDETSSDYLVVKLSSPVQSNGEPFDKCSPEFFTEEKISPDKRDQSPPRAESSSNSGSPSSSLSLKKNRPQAMRPGGRAAHMLGLCVPDSLNTIKNSERADSDEPKKGNTSTPARRNLRVLYNAVGDNSDMLGENENNENFLKFKRSLPSTDSSPSVPILKRKLIDIVDDASASPASKRKRVSFHDPPVSTTVSVQKYIEPGCKSPSSAHKRLERQLMRTLTKSPKRLDNAFVKLDTVLCKAVESFIEEQADSLNDTNISMDVTPAIAVVNTSELNDTDPIYPDLVECKDSIENIAAELSSPAMKDLLVKELEGKVGIVGDLAKMTELEVNRLCIKAPKVQIVKKVLTDYANKRVTAQDFNVPEATVLPDDTTLAIALNEEMIESEPITACAGTQTTKVSVSDTGIQTRTEIVKLAFSQTDIVNTTHSSMQTVESGFISTSEVISSCLSERKDFIDKLGEQLEEASFRKISDKFPTETIIEILANKCDDSTSTLIINKILDGQNQYLSNDERRRKKLLNMKDYLCESFDKQDLILLCSQLLQAVLDKPS